MTSDAVHRLRASKSRKLPTLQHRHRQQELSDDQGTCLPDFAIKAENWPREAGTTLAGDWLLNCLSGHWLHSLHPDLQQVRLWSSQVLPDNRCNFGQNTGWRCNFVFKWERNELISFLRSLGSRVIVYISLVIHQSRDFLVTTMT